MGLLGKALSARSEEPRPQGLLKKSIDLAEPAGAPMLVTQQELDALLPAKPESATGSAMPHRTARAPASVPLTWTAAGLGVPQGTKGPEISKDELDRVLGKILPAFGSEESRPEAASSPMEPASPLEALPAPGPEPSEGLLASAARAVQAPRADTVEDPVAKAMARLLPAIQALPQGIELPAAVFCQIVESLSLVKAAFLLYDPLRLVYAPWASVGYDETTLHRLRVSLGANPSFNSISNGIPAVVSGKDDLGAYQRYFSSREFSQIGTLLLVPFIHEEKLIGVLMISESQGPLAGTKGLVDILSHVARESAPVLHAAREARLRTLPSSEIPESDRGEKELEAFLEKSRQENKKVLLLSMSFAGLLKAVRSRASHIDAFRLREDMRTILNGFLSDLGRAISLPSVPDAWILAVPDARKADAPLLMHQLATYLQLVFAGIGASDTLDPSAARTLGWPEECGDVREILSRFTA